MRSLIGIVILSGICSSPATPSWLEGEPFRPTTNAEIAWSATNSPPKELWIYQVMPGAFSAGVISNAMTLGSFTMKDLTKAGIPPFQDKNLLHFENKNEFGRRRWLYIAPSLGTMKYLSERDTGATVETVPTSDEAEALARAVLLRLGIDRSLLAERVRKGYDETSTQIDRNGNTLGPERVISRGVSFERRIDGVALSENWCFLIHFGSKGRIEDFTLRWRNILPGALRPVFPADEFVQMIKSGQAVLPQQFHDTSGVLKARKLRITKFTPFYFDGYGKELLNFLVPYADLEITGKDGETEVSAVLRCPIIDESKPLN